MRVWTTADEVALTHQEALLPAAFRQSGLSNTQRSDLERDQSVRQHPEATEFEGWFGL
jgi:hypothetical protein